MIARDLLVLWLSCLGIAQLLRPIGRDWLGMRFYLAILLLPIVLFISNYLLRIPLDIGARGLALIALAGLFSGLKKDARRDLPKSLLHPAILLPPVFLILLSVLGAVHHETARWDEFSHWLTMPRQIVLFRDVPSPLYPMKDFYAYTPGWPLIVAYPFLLLGVPFSPHPTIYSALFCAFGLIALIYDLIRSFLQQREYGLSAGIAWAAVLVILYYNPFSSVYPLNALIEPPLLYSIIALPLIVCLWELNRGDRVRQGVCVAIGLAGGYFMKHTYYTAFPSAALLLLLTALQRKEGWRSILRDGVIWFLPPIALILLWQHATADGPVNPFPVVGPGFKASDVLKDLIEGKETLSKMWLTLFKYQDRFGVLTSYLYKCAGSGLVLGLFWRHLRAISLFAISFSAVYFFSLYYMYMTAYKGQPAEILVGYERYILLAVDAAAGLGIGLLGAILFDLASKIPFRLPAPAFLRRCVAAAVSISLVITLIHSVRYYQIHHGPSVPEPVVTAADRLTRILEKRGMIGAQVQMIAQRTQGFEYLQSIHASIGHQHLSYVMNEYYSFGEKKHDVWTMVTTREKLREKISSAPVIWVIQSDSWVDPILDEIADQDCRKPYSGSFLIRQPGSAKYECVAI